MRRIILQALAPHRLNMSLLNPGAPLSFSLSSMSPGAQQAAAIAAAASIKLPGNSISGGMGSKTTSLAVSDSHCFCLRN
jgi:hypothetical protein